LVRGVGHVHVHVHVHVVTACGGGGGGGAALGAGWSRRGVAHHFQRLLHAVQQRHEQLC
jgi:hypothetical protein